MEEEKQECGKLRDHPWRAVLLAVLAVAGLLLGPLPARAADAGWTSMDNPTQGTSNILLGVYAVSPTDVYAVGSAGTILHYDGTAWASMTSDTTRRFNGVWGSGPGDIYAVAQIGTILHYDGTAWTPMNSGTTKNLYGVWGSGPTDVYAVGSAGTILHYDGTAWTPMTSGTDSSTLYGVWGSGPTDVYAVTGASGTILHYDGTAWTPMTSDNTQSLLAIGGSGPGDVYAVGSAGTILHYDGTAWTPMTSGTSSIIRGVWGSGPGDVYAAGDDIAILHYDGSAWIRKDSGSIGYFQGISGSNNDVFVVGGDGHTILHHTISAAVHVTGVTLDKTSLTLTTGASDTLVATVAPPDATDKAVTWTSDNETVATVDSSGTVTGHVYGSATITATTVDGGFTATCLVTVTTSGPPVTAGWPKFQYDLYNGGVTTEVAPVSSPVVGWKQQVGSTSMAGINVSPLVVGNSVFVLDAYGKTWSFDAQTGAENWSTQLSATAQIFQLATPAYDSGWFYVATNDGHVYRLSNTDGSIAWEVTLPVTDKYSQLNTTVTYADGKVYVGAWTSYSSKNEYYYCLDAATGAPGIGGSYQIPDTVSKGGYYWAGASIVGDYLIFGSDKAVLTCLNKDTGAVVSSVNLKTIESTAGVVRSSVSYEPAASMLFLTDERGWCWAFDFDAATGAITHRWHYSTGYSTSTPAIYNGRVYVGSGSVYQGQGSLYCLDEATGSLVWQFNANGPVESSPSISVQNGAPYIYFSVNTSRSVIDCLDQNGNLVWQFAEQEPEGSTRYTLQGASIAGGWLYFGNDGGYLYALKSPTTSVTGVTLDKESLTLTAGSSDTLTATITPTDATDQSLTWTSDNETVATVNSSGAVTGHVYGTATITVTTVDGGYTATCLVTVQATQNSYDLNNDNAVNVQDMVLIGQRFAESGDPGWISEDVNQDGRINVQDLALTGQHFTI